MIQLHKIYLGGLVLALTQSTVLGQVARNIEVEKPIEQQDGGNIKLLEQRFSEIKNDPQLTQRGQAHYYQGKYLEAIQFPVGGVGTGCVQFNGQAVPQFWQIFNNMGHDSISNSFMALRVTQGDKTLVRALQTSDVLGLKGMESLRCKNEFPFLQYEFQDNLPVSVALSVYNPFVPTDIKSSGIPAVFYRVTLKNTSDQAVEVELLASQQNAIGLSKAPIVNAEVSFADNYRLSRERQLVKGNSSSYYGTNWNESAELAGAKVLRMCSQIPQQDEHYGEMALMIFDEDAQLNQTRVITSWEDANSLFDHVSDKKTLPSALGETYSGAISTKVKLAPQQEKVFQLALVWYFPHGINGGKAPKWDAWGQGKWHGKGNYYAKQWPDMQSLTSYIAKNHHQLYLDSKSFHNTFFQTNLPYWLVERLSSQLAILKSRTIFHDKEGYVGLWEGSGAGDGSCAGNCNHVWHYAQAHARLFPELGRRIREQAYHFMKPNGQIPYRQPAGSHAFDGQCGDIIATYREHLLSRDKQWLQSQYPKVRQAMSYVIDTWDKDRDGWLQGSMHTTYDCGMSGNASFLTSLYLAALSSSIEMAKLCEDSQAEQEWTQLLQAAKKIQNEKLWNGEYYTQSPDPKSPASDYLNGCHSDQLLGQWWADQLDLGELFPSQRTSKAFNAILKHNFKSIIDYHKQSPRQFAQKGEPAFIVTTWPNGDRPGSAPAYSDEVWPLFEYTIAASLIRQGQIADAFVLLKAGAMRYDGRLRKGYFGAWGNFGFSGNPFGDDECGQFYSRSLSHWSVLLATSGFDYNGPKGILSFRPQWQPSEHRSFFSTSEGWGLFTQQLVNASQHASIRLKYGTLELNNLILKSLTKEKDIKPSVKLNGKIIPFSFSTKQKDYIFNFEGLKMKRGDILEVLMDAKKTK